jgi:hypothetical protein
MDENHDSDRKAEQISISSCKRVHSSLGARDGMSEMVSVRFLRIVAVQC